MNNSVLEKIKGELIVSCQALPDEPLHSSFIMSKMALAAVQGGAMGIRANTAEDIRAIQNEVNVPIIGILKQVYDDCNVFITPTLKEVREICETGAEIVAMDATKRPRPNNENLEEILQIIRKEFPSTILMADTGSMEDVQYADSLGFDLIGTTLYGYTDETANQDISNQDFSHLKEVLKSTKRPVIAEGKIDSPDKASEVLKLGCHAVVVGGAITRPQEITTRFTKKIKGIL